jgi:hypothetical protein
MKQAIIKSLKDKSELAHTELVNAIKSYFKKNKIRFEGSVEWYMEWVKLDLEANGIISRLGDKGKIRYTT